MRVLVVENMSETPLGLVGVALQEAGATIDLRRPHAGEALPAGPEDHDGLVVLGGEQSALDDADHPHLPELAQLMKAFALADRSVLGICLGSQLLARGHGADNHLGIAKEFGWHQVELTEEGLTDPVLSVAGAHFPIFEWHGDTFSLPEGAVHLARNGTVAHQAFRIGRAAYGTQFHFEAGRSVVEEWRQRFAPVIERTAPGWLAGFEDHAARHAEAADVAGLAMARAWVATIRT